jgi:hypothetical protein
MMVFANGGVLDVGLFSTSAADVIVVIVTAGITAARKPDVDSGAKRIVNTSKPSMARPTTATGSGITADGGQKVPPKGPSA